VNRLALRLLVGVAAALAALGAPAVAAAQQNTKLFAKVGPGFEIVLRDANGVRVTQLDPGTYDIEVDDASEEHNFHLSGPGVDRTTTVEFVGKANWTVSFVNGRYVYICDPHATVMRGTFTVGAPAPPPTPAPPRRLVATVGPAATISVANAAGTRVRTVAAGTYRVTVRDRSARHNFHLIGPGVNRRTGVAFRGTVTWTVRVRAGATYRFVCDPHARHMRGSFRGR
jgi:plastocyanin